ncbi:MAG: hypothetical protein ABI675_02730 [Chitinophagaceae bacterium]
MPTITRKIELHFVVDDKKELAALYKKWYGWQYIVRRAANYITTHLWLQQQVKDLFYLHEDVKVKLADFKKDPDGILTTSKTNTTYQVLSKHFKGEAPMGMISGLNGVVSKSFEKEAIDVNNGLKALRTYRDNIPMPVRTADISQWEKLPDGNYSFFVYGTKFKTWFGRDLSLNETVLDRAVVDISYKHPQNEIAQRRKEKRNNSQPFASNEDESVRYKFCDSSICLDNVKDEKGKKKTKFFLLASFTIPTKQDIKLDPEKIANCWLDEEYPLIIKQPNGKEFNIGTKNEYQYRRLAIKGAISRIQSELKYNPGGKGRAAKMQALERFTKAETKYVEQKLHSYSKYLIKYCVERGIGTIRLNGYDEAKKKTQENTEKSKLLLATWGYYGLSEKIKYKALFFGIEVVIPEPQKDDTDPPLTTGT